MKLDRFINRPVLSTVISILIVILGILGLLSLPITQYPDIAPPTVSVKATYTGANAQTVLNSVIAPLEDQINGVENMMYMTSSASNNGSYTGNSGYPVHQTNQERLPRSAQPRHLQRHSEPVYIVPSHPASTKYAWSSRFLTHSHPPHLVHAVLPESG